MQHIVPLLVSVHNFIVATLCIVVIVTVYKGNNWTIKGIEGGQNMSKGV